MGSVNSNAVLKLMGRGGVRGAGPPRGPGRGGLRGRACIIEAKGTCSSYVVL